MINNQELEDFEAWLIEEELSENTRKSYLYSIKTFFEFADEVTKTNLIKWKNKLMQTHSPKTVNLRLAGMRAYCDYKGIPFTVKQIKLQKSTSVENVITIEQYNKLIEGLTD